MMMSSDMVMDPVNKYRHGVLVGNFVEDKFGRDLQAKGPNPDAPKTTTSKTNHDLRHSLQQPNSYIGNQPGTSQHFYGTQAEQPPRPEHHSSYTIHHAQEVAPQVPLMENNPRREQQQQRQGTLYAHTRHQLSRQFNRNSQPDPTLAHLPDEIPDILTGEILKAKGSTGNEIKHDQKGKMRIEANTNTKSINPYGTQAVVKPTLKQFQEVTYRDLVLPHHKGEKRDVLFGHGLNLEDFQKRQLATSYELSYGQRVPPQTQINSFYEPNHHDIANHKSFYKTNASQMNQTQTGERVTRPYQPYTATYDKNHLKHEYLRK